MSDECGEPDCDCSCINAHYDYFEASVAVDQENINDLNDLLLVAQSQQSEDSMWMMYWINRRYICNCEGNSSAMADAPADGQLPQKPLLPVPVETIKQMAEQMKAFNVNLKAFHQRHLAVKAELKALKDQAKEKMTPPDPAKVEPAV